MLRNVAALLISLLLLIAAVAASPFYTAQGDSANISFVHANGTCWYFGNAGQDSELYDIPAVMYNNTTYCQLSSKLSGTMQGTYDIVYTYPSLINNVTPFKDISWDNGLKSVLAASKFVDESGKQSKTVKADLIDLITVNGIDNYETSQIIVDKPSLTIDRIEAKTDVIEHIQGTTNLQNGSIVTIKVDEMERYALHDYANYTFTTMVNRPDILALGTWECDMMLPLQTMSPGWHNVKVYSGDVQSTVRFPIYQYWTPVPTPTQYINYFGNGSIKPDVITVEVTVPVYITQKEYIQLTATPTPPILDALGNTIKYPYEKGTEISPSIGIVLLLLLAAIVLLKGGKK